MTRLLVITLFLLLSSVPAYAEWVLIGTANGLTTYFDPATIRRKGDLVKMWELWDFKIKETKGGKSFLSAKYQLEFDCAEERTRELAHLWFSGNMGKGNVVTSESNEGKWTPVSPDSVGETHWKVACSKQ